MLINIHTLIRLNYTYTLYAYLHNSETFFGAKASAESSASNARSIVLHFQGITGHGILAISTVIGSWNGRLSYAVV